MVAKNLELGGREYVILDRRDYNLLLGRRSPAHRARSPKIPPIPKSNAQGLRPAGQTLRAILARDIIKERLELGWSQRELARRAGIRPETLCRIESGQTTPTVATVQRIDDALRSAR